MNKLCFRVVFNRHRGMLMAVQETAASDTGSSSGSRPGRRKMRSSRPSFKGFPLSPVLKASALAWALALGTGTSAFAQTSPTSVQASPAAPAGQRPIVDAAGNGVPLVHIAPPTAAGISRNGYQRLDVDTRGLILNNSARNVQTQLGGWVGGNPQLGYVPARVIVNEVLGPDPSSLKGAIEVAGQRADVVISNPNGLSCDGCSFIDTGRATLSTGVPQYDARGALTGFDVRRGSITVGSLGLDVRALDQLDLFARGLILQGQVSAQALMSVIGPNQIGYAATGVQPGAVAQAGQGDAPLFAVDIGAMGGGVAGRVYLVATEKGLGVNSSGRLAALEGELVLTADGNLDLKDTYARDGMRLGSSEDMRLTGTTMAGGAVSDGASSPNATGNPAADMHLQAGGVLAQAGLLDASGVVDVQAGGLEHTGTSIQRADTAPMRWTISSDAANSGKLWSAGALQLQAGRYIDTSGQLNALGVLTLQAGSITATGSQWYAGANAQLQATAGDFSATGLTVHALQDLQLGAAGLFASQDGAWQADGAAHVQAANVRNGARFTTSTSLDVVAAGRLENTNGQWGSDGALTLTATQVDNHGGVVAGEDTRIQAASIDNTQGTISARGALRVEGMGATNAVAPALVNDGGTLVSGGSLRATVSSLSNQGGQIVARGGDDTAALPALALNAAALNNRAGQIVAIAGSTQLEASTLDNTAGTISAAQALDLTSPQGVLVNHGGTLTAGRTLSASAAGLDNTQGTLSTSELHLQLGEHALVSDGGSITATESAQITASSLSNRGGTFVTGGRFSFGTTKTSLDNQGGTLQARELDLQAGRLDNTGGRLLGIEGLNIQAQALLNQRGSLATTASGSDLAVHSDQLDNTQGQLQSAGRLDLLSTTVENAQGRLHAEDALTGTSSS